MVKQWYKFFKSLASKAIILNISLILHFLRLPEEIQLVELFQNQPAKITALVVSSLGTFIITPILLIIVKYEKEKHYKSLINKLIYSSLLISVIQGSVTELLMLFLYMFGPLSEWICYYDLVTRPGVAMYDILLLDSLFVVRYLFMFHAKSPTTIQEEFWCFFINVWIISFCTISHLVFAILPGNNPNFFYICLGKIPLSHKHSATKVNLALLYTLSFSILAHLMVGIRYQIYRWQEKNKTAPTVSTQTTVTHNNLNKSSLPFKVVLIISREKKRIRVVFQNLSIWGAPTCIG